MYRRKIRMKIVVLAGGFSPEREVSLSSGAMITNSLMKNGHEVYLLDSYLGVADGEAVCFKSLKDGTDLSWEIGRKVPELDRLRKERKGEGYIGNRVIDIQPRIGAFIPEGSLWNRFLFLVW